MLDTKVLITITYTVINKLYYQLYVSTKFLEMSTATINLLKNELVSNALDQVKVRRRLRMISQVSEYQSQIFKKICLLESDHAEDYESFLNDLNTELHQIIDRNS